MHPKHQIGPLQPHHRLARTDGAVPTADSHARGVWEYPAQPGSVCLCSVDSHGVQFELRVVRRCAYHAATVMIEMRAALDRYDPIEIDDAPLLQIAR